MSLAHDVFLLSHALRLDADVLERLRERAQYQGARYELAVASVFARVGFGISWIPPTPGAATAEFRGSRGGVEIDVEAKSRHRAGVLNEPGEAAEPERARINAGRLLNDAAAKADGRRAFVAFVDLNLPESARREKDDDWIRAIKPSFAQRSIPTAAAPDVVSAYFLTNFAWHHLDEAPVTSPGTSFTVVSEHVAQPIPEGIILELRGALSTYGHLPPRSW